MLNPSQIDVATLPSVALTERGLLPNSAGIYFAIASDNSIQYIGRTKNLWQRWRGNGHHRFRQLDKLSGVRLSYLVMDAELVEAVEEALIKWFNPPLNGIEWAKKNRRKKDEKQVATWRLIEVMSRYGIKGVDLARELEISTNAVSNLRLSKSMPLMDGKRLGQLCNALNKLSKEDEVITPSHLIDYVYEQTLETQ